MTEATDSDRGRLLLFALVATSVAVLVVGSVVGVVVPGAAVGETATDGDHADPDTVASESDLGAVERRMADQLAERARSGSLNVSREDADRAREALNGSEYESILREYSEVANETGRSNRSVAFREVQVNQAAFVEAVDRYWRLHEWYQAVRDGRVARQRAIRGSRYRPGPEPTPRRAARRLERQWHAVNESHAALVAAYGALARSTGENFSEPVAEVDRTTAAVNETQQRVRRAQFVATTLEARTNATTVSFRDPMTVSGRLLTDNGTPVADRSVTLAVGNRTVRTRTDGEGRFDFEYRPTLVSANATTVTVRYVPDADSVYLRSERTLDVAVEPASPDVAVSVRPDRAVYNDTVRVSGRVGADDAGAGNVTYLMILGGRVVAEGTTGPDGRFARTARVPADVPAGEQSVRVRLPLAGRALLGTDGTTTLTVEETATDLTGSVDHVEDRTIRVAGTLETVDGVPVADRRVSVAANGTALGTVTTGRDGTFEGRFELPDGVGSPGPFDSSTTVDVRMTYDGRTANLESATASDSTRFSTVPIAFWAGGAVLAFGGIAAVVWLGRHLAGRVRSRIGTEREDGASVPARRLDAHRTETGASASALLSFARDRIAEGHPEAAISAGYAALRRRLDAEVGGGATMTPWEFYRAAERSGLDEEVLATLRRATELYEYARFTSDSPPPSSVEETLESLESTVRSA